MEVTCNAGAQPQLSITPDNDAFSMVSGQAYGELRGPHRASLRYHWQLDPPAPVRAAGAPLQWMLNATLPAGQFVPDGTYNGALMAVLEF